MRLTIARKLYAGFLAVLALMVVLGLVGMSGLNSAREHSNDMYTHAVVPVVDLGKARAQTNESQKIVSDHILESSDAGRAELEDTLAANSKRANTQLQAVAKTIETPEERAAIANLQKSLPAYRDAREKVLELSRQDRDAEAYELSTQALSPLADEAAASFEELYDSKVKLAETQKQAIVDEASKGRTQAILLMLLGLAIGLGIAWLVARGIVRAVKQVLAATDGIAAGDVDQKIEVKSRDELGDVAEATQRMVDYVKEMSAHADRIAAGDLTVDVEPRSGRDALGNAFSTMVGNLRELVGRVGSTAGTLSASSHEMASASQEAGKAVGEIASAVSDVAQGAERQVKVVEAARSATQEVTAAVGESAANAQETARVAEEAREIAREGVEAAGQATEAMKAVRDSSQSVSDAIRDLAAKSEQIGGIVATITGISEQTNLLALNAAIEAARAGEQGRGFAVVAEEVRKLAEESQAAAGQIGGLIGEIQAETQNAVTVVEDGTRRTADGAATVEQTREAFERIGGSVEDMSGRIGQIAAAVQQIAANANTMETEIGEVAAVAEQSSASAEEVSASTEQTSASTQQIAASAEELAATAEELERLVGRFTLA